MWNTALFTQDSSISTMIHRPFLMPPRRKALPGWRIHQEQISSRRALYHAQTIFSVNSSDMLAFLMLVCFAK